MPLEILDQKINLMILYQKSAQWSVYTLLWSSLLLALIVAMVFGGVFYVIGQGITFMSVFWFFLMVMLVIYGVMYVANLNQKPDLFFIFDKENDVFIRKQHFLDDRGEVIQQFSITEINKAKIRAFGVVIR